LAVFTRPASQLPAHSRVCLHRGTYMPIQNSREGQPRRTSPAETRYLVSKLVCLNLDGLLPPKARAAAQIIYHLPTRQVFKAGESIQSPGPRSAILVEEGAVHILPPNESDEIPMRRLGPGYVFGNMPRLGMATFGARMVAAVACVIVFLDQDTFQTIVQKSSEIAFRVIEMLVRRLPESDADRVIKGFGIVESMLYRQLRRLADEDGVIDTVSQRDLGHFLGVSRQAVSGALKGLRRRGLVETSRLHIKLLKLDKTTNLEKEKTYER
jgi:CRP/FNR family transcriptional regulator, cyclic AMP receptor protein